MVRMNLDKVLLGAVFGVMLLYVVLGSGLIVEYFSLGGDAGSSNVVAGFDFNRYVSPDGAYEFSFPVDWVVEREFDTRNDFGVSVRGVVIREDVCDNGNNWIYVNPDFVSCDVGDCVVIGDNTIVTYTDDPSFYEVFRSVVQSFAVRE